MQQLIKIIEDLKEINSAYGLSNEKLDSISDDMQAAKVCTPIIGKFSSGKSAIFNTLLPYSRKLLKEDITPETAIPTEIVYAENEGSEPVTIFYNNNEVQAYSIEEFRKKELDANTTKRARLMLSNSFLSTIPDVMLVDMPGFESGIEIHNRAIDGYLSESLAYLIAFPAEDMVLRSTMGNILRELSLHNMPLGIVITKCDKVDLDTLDDNLEHLKGSLRKYIGDTEVTFCLTSSQDGEVEDLKQFLLKVQQHSQQILHSKFKKSMEASMSISEQYLNALIKNSQLSESELSEKEDELNEQIARVQKSVSKDTDEFERQTSGCVEAIVQDVNTALRNSESTLITMILNNQSINEQMNATVRNTVTSSIQRRYIAIVTKYIDKVTNDIQIDSVTNAGVVINLDTEKIQMNIIGAGVAGVAGGLAIGLPILGGIVAALIAGIAKLIRNKNREEAKAQIRQRLDTEVFPNIVQQVRRSLEIEISKQITEIKNQINENVVAQRNALEKALADLKNQQMEEQKQKDMLLNDIHRDLEKIEEIRHGLR